jgi:hypothetical protein
MSTKSKIPHRVVIKMLRDSGGVYEYDVHYKDALSCLRSYHKERFPSEPTGDDVCDYITYMGAGGIEDLIGREASRVWESLSTCSISVVYKPLKIQSPSDRFAYLIEK